MAKAKDKLPGGRLPAKRTITKQQAIRHLIHAAVRMIAAGEDPFAIQLMVQSADKLLIDVAKKKKQALPFTWGSFVKPEYKDAVIETVRETYNFLKHADKDHDQTLHVAEIAASNILQLAMCIVNYHSLFGAWTDHMQLLFTVAKFVFPDSLVHSDQRAQFEAMLPKIDNITLADFFSGWWTDSVLMAMLPNLAREKAEDLQDTQPLYSTNVSEIHKRR
jgi:hypothetical protein